MFIKNKLPRGIMQANLAKNELEPASGQNYV